MSLHLTPAQIDELPAWEDTAAGKAEAAAKEIAPDIAPHVIHAVLVALHRSAVEACNDRPLPTHAGASPFDGLAAVLDPLLACAVSASQTTDLDPCCTIGMDGFTVAAAILTTVADRCGIPDGHPGHAPDDDGSGASRHACFMNAIAENASDSAPPWPGPHPITDRARRASGRIDADLAVRLARKALATLDGPRP